MNTFHQTHLFRLGLTIFPIAVEGRRTFETHPTKCHARKLTLQQTPTAHRSPQDRKEAPTTESDLDNLTSSRSLGRPCLTPVSAPHVSRDLRRL